MTTTNGRALRAGPSLDAPVWRRRHLALFYGVAGVTIHRWEQDRKLPPRDVMLGGKRYGWRPETIRAATQSAT